MSNEEEDSPRPLMSYQAGSLARPSYEEEDACQMRRRIHLGL